MNRSKRILKVKTVFYYRNRTRGRKENSSNLNDWQIRNFNIVQYRTPQQRYISNSFNSFLYADYFLMTFLLDNFLHFSPQV